MNNNKKILMSNVNCHFFSNHIYLTIFCNIWSAERDISGLIVQRIHQNIENGGFYEKLLSENDFEAVLAHFCCYDYRANASEVVQTIAADQKHCHKCSSCVIVCWIAKIYQSITVKNGWY